MEYLLHFFLGGGIIAATVYLTDHLDTKYAALAYAFPLSLSIALFITHLKHDNQTVSNLAKNTVYGLLLTIGFAIIFAILAPRFGFWVAFTVSIFCFLGSGWLFIKYF